MLCEKYVPLRRFDGDDMSLLDLLLIAIGLSMDSLAVALACGMLCKRLCFWPFLSLAFFFGLFQGGMPLIGWLAGSAFNEVIGNYDHWIAFIILAALGGKMVVGHFKARKNPECKSNIDPRKILVVITLALATSIDALAVGLTFAFLDFEPLRSSLIIGGVTFVVTWLGLVLGSRCGCRFKIPAELLGGLVLVGIGGKILIEHLFFAA